MDIICQFTPQASIKRGKYIIDVDPPEGCETTWRDTVPDGLAIPDPDSYESDFYRESPNAPTWVQEWSGPFKISVRAIGEGGEQHA